MKLNFSRFSFAVVPMKDKIDKVINRKLGNSLPYRCMSCGKLFYAKKSFLNLLLQMRVTCPHCKSTRCFPAHVD